MSVGQYAWNVGLAFDRFANAVLGGDPEWSLSERMGQAIREDRCWGCYWICRALALIDRRHCRRVYEKGKPHTDRLWPARVAVVVGVAALIVMGVSLSRCGAAVYPGHVCDRQFEAVELSGVEAFEGQVLDDETVDIRPVACVLDINADERARGVTVQDHPVHDLFRIAGLSFSEVNVQRIRSRVVIQLHGLNLLSGKALWIVTPSGNVTTRR